MIIFSRVLKPRLAALVGGVLAALLGSAILGAPAAAASSIPVWSIKSVSDVIATRDTLLIDEVVLEIGYLGPQEIKFRFELDGRSCCAWESPALFLAGQPDPCHAVGAVPTRVVECAYTRNVVEGRDESFSFRHKISRPGASESPSLRITVELPGSSMSIGRTVQRVKPQADLVVGVDGPAPGPVGGIVNFTWSVANVGLDPVYERSGMITFVAPSGTEFADSLADSPPDDMTCLAGASSTRRQCFFRVIDPGKANGRKETWRLRILSGQVADGRFTAALYNATGQHPHYDYEDPTPANNEAAIRISVLPAAHAPGLPPADASGSPAPTQSDTPAPAGSEPPAAALSTDSAARRAAADRWNKRIPHRHGAFPRRGRVRRPARARRRAPAAGRPVGRDGHSFGSASARATVFRRGGRRVRDAPPT